MDWLQVFMIAGSTIGACYWMHTENRQDAKQNRQEMKEFTKEFREQIKEFHGRLCALEEKYIQMMQRMLEKK